MWTGARPAASGLAREEKNLNYLSLLLPGRRGQNLNVSTVGSEHLLSLCTMHYNGASKTMVASSLMSLVLQPIPTVPTCRAPYPGTSVFSVSSAPVPACPLSRWTVMCDAECHVSRVTSPDQDDSQLCLPSAACHQLSRLLLTCCLGAGAELVAPSLNLRRHDSHDRTKITIKIHNNGGRGECQCSRIKHPHPTLTPHALTPRTRIDILPHDC